MISQSSTDAPGVLAEDRLLWELWLNHGLEPAPLRARVAELPAGAAGWYLAGNALYGGFEEGLFRALREGAPGRSAPAGAIEALRFVVEGPAGRVTLDDPEGKLLALLALWPAASSEEARRAADASSRVTRWPALFRAAGRSNLLAAVAAGVRAAVIAGRIPAPVDAAIESAAAGIERRSRRILPLVEEITSALARSGIRHCLLKESALIGEIYREPGERPVGDVDLLVAGSDLGGVEEILVRAGHRPFEGIWSREWYRSHHHHAVPLVSAEAATKFEPHTGIWIPGGAAVDLSGEILATAVPHPRFSSLRPDATLMAFHLLVDLHGGAGAGKGGQAADLMRFLAVEGGKVDGDRLLGLAKRTRSRTYVEDSVDLVAEAFGRETLRSRAPALATIRRERTSAGDRLRRRIERNLLLGFEPRASAVSVAAIKQVHLSLMLPVSDAARAADFIRSIVAGRKGREGAGEIALKERGPAARHVLRLATFPFRALARTIRAKRGS